MNKSNIVLIGMAGAGKSTIGKLLAEKMDRYFVDGDKYMEEKEGMTIRQILQKNGDEKFVEIEEKRLAELLPLKNTVLATGGSAVYSERLMNLFRGQALIVWLVAPFSVINKRIADDEERGIVNLKEKTLERLFKERESLYEKYADIKIDINQKSPDEIVDLCLSEIVERTT